MNCWDADQRDYYYYPMPGTGTKYLWERTDTTGQVVPFRSRGVWSWRLSFFMIFSLIYFGGRGTVRLGFNASLQGRNSRKNTVVKDPRLERISSTSVFLIRTAPTLLDRKSSNLLHQSSNQPFQYKEVLEWLHGMYVHTYYFWPTSVLNL